MGLFQLKRINFALVFVLVVTKSIFQLVFVAILYKFFW